MPTVLDTTVQPNLENSALGQLHRIRVTKKFPDDINWILEAGVWNDADNWNDSLSWVDGGPEVALTSIANGDAGVSIRALLNDIIDDLFPPDVPIINYAIAGAADHTSQTTLDNAVVTHVSPPAAGTPIVGVDQTKTITIDNVGPLTFLSGGVSAGTSLGFTKEVYQSNYQVVASNVYNLSSYVTDPNNAATTRSQIQAAFDALESTGGTLNFQSGVTYLINAGLIITGGATPATAAQDFQIKGANSTIQMTGNATASLLTFERCKNFHVENLIVDGNSANRTNGTHNIIFFEVNSQEIGGGRDHPEVMCSFDNVDSINAKGAGFDCWIFRGDDSFGFVTAKHPWNIRMHNCTGVNSNRNGLSVNNVHNLQILGGSFTGNIKDDPQAGIDIEPNFLSDVYSYTVNTSTNVFTASGLSAALMAEIYVTGTAVIVANDLKGNVFPVGTAPPAPLQANTVLYYVRLISPGVTTTFTLHATAASALNNTGIIDITTAGTGPQYVAGAHGNTISDVLIRGVSFSVNNGSGILISAPHGGKGATSNITIEGCYFTDGAPAPRIDNTAGGVHNLGAKVLIQYNLFETFDRTGQDGTVVLQSTACFDCRVVNNYFNDILTGGDPVILVRSTSGINNFVTHNRAHTISGTFVNPGAATASDNLVDSPGAPTTPSPNAPWVV